ncbi:Peroxiredoxin V protein [Oopsacas minuta]|uniref:Peroxiredoxin-5 n=1 Tax=Oopsacas minuta TaxID=111878 RepID=A0AAV7JQ81_9METZ|nr:Peroxiredoxin V protein [Oopsacas minuta]
MTLRIATSGIRLLSLKRMSNIKELSIKAGDVLPSRELTEGTIDNKVNIKQLFSGKKGILFSVPGAFTPTCSKTHLPGFVKDIEIWRKRGFNPIVCVSVNDVFVMSAWGLEHKVDGKVRMLSDVDAIFTKEIGLDFDASGILGGTRSKRYSMVVENGVVTNLNVEPDSSKIYTCSKRQGGPCELFACAALLQKTLDSGRPRHYGGTAAPWPARTLLPIQTNSNEQMATNESRNVESLLK